MKKTHIFHVEYSAVEKQEAFDHGNNKNQGCIEDCEPANGLRVNNVQNSGGKVELNVADQIGESTFGSSKYLHSWQIHKEDTYNL